MEAAMSDHKAVVWFEDDPVPNGFFFRSPFRSWKFLLNTAVLAALIFGLAFILVRNWNNWSVFSKLFWGAFLMLQGALYPYLRVLQSHRKINELYLAGKIKEQPAESPIDKLLSVAEDALNDGLLYSSFTAGLLLFFGFFLRLR
jgi:hypothetical protein